MSLRLLVHFIQEQWRISVHSGRFCVRSQHPALNDSSLTLQTMPAYASTFSRPNTFGASWTGLRGSSVIANLSEIRGSVTGIPSRIKNRLCSLLVGPQQCNHRKA